MAFTYAIDASDGPEVSFTRILLTIQTLEDDLDRARETAKRAVSERDGAQTKLQRLEDEVSACRSEMQKAVSELEHDKQHWTAQVKSTLSGCH